MKFKAKKSYGNYKTISCPFCGRIATQKNAFALEVCYLHTKEQLQEIKCSCGSWLVQNSGKFGPYFNCINCGNINLKKALELRALTKSRTSNSTQSIASNLTNSITNNLTKNKISAASNYLKQKETSLESEDKNFKQSGIPTELKQRETSQKQKEKKELTITSDDLEYFS